MNRQGKRKDQIEFAEKAAFGGIVCIIISVVIMILIAHC